MSRDVAAGYGLETVETLARGSYRAPSGRTVDVRALVERLSGIPAAMAVRTRKVLSLAAHHRHRQLVLGAWGCGAFGIESGVMAGIFHEALTTEFRGVFERVVFAITDWSPERRSSGAFEALLVSRSRVGRSEPDRAF